MADPQHNPIGSTLNIHDIKGRPGRSTSRRLKTKFFTKKDDFLKISLEKPKRFGYY
jgi:hypothetical protein